MENAAEPERNPESDKMIIEMKTIPWAYITAKVSEFNRGIHQICMFTVL